MNKIFLLQLIMIFVLLFVPNKIYSENQSENLSLNENNSRGQIEVISEPIFGQNKNFASSGSASFTVENDKIYVVWNDYSNIDNSGTDVDIFFRYYDGSKWSDIQIISEPVSGNNINTGGSQSPKIAVENGKIYVVWSDTTNINHAGTDSDIFYRCNLTGYSWEPVQVISEHVTGNDFNIGTSGVQRIAVEDGKIYVVWHDKNNTYGAGDLDYDLFYRCNITGSSWENVQVISEPVTGQNYNTGNSSHPSMAIENGNIYLAWQDENNTDNAGTDWDIFFRSNLTGSGWKSIEVISEPNYGFNNNVGASRDPDIAVENNNIYISWHDDNNTNGAGTDVDIFYKCNLTGLNWEAVQVISEPIQGTNYNIERGFSPAIAVENDKIHVVWHDMNDINNSGTDPDIFYRCNRTGSSWENIQIISEPMPDSNNNIWSSYGSDIEVNFGMIHVIWEDLTNINGAGTDSDIFYRLITSSQPVLSFGNVIPTSGNTSTIFNFTVIYADPDNEEPIKIIANISDVHYSMLEVNPNDTDYVNGKEYYYSISHLNIGLYSHQFWASDGFFSQSTSFVNKPIVFNTPPNIITQNNLIAVEDIYYEINYEYDDIDIVNIGQIGTWNFITNATWLNFNQTIATLYGIPTNDNVGKYWVNISINDSIDMDFVNFTLTVINVNDAPLIITNDVKTINEDEYYEIKYEATDIDTPQNDLIWAIKTNATWLDFDSSEAVLNGTPTNEEVGSYWVNIIIDDGDGGLDFTNFTLIVINLNDPPEIPIIYKPINDEKFNTSSKIDFIGFCTDVDEIYGDKLTYTWISNISGIIGIGDSIYNHILSVGYHNITLIVSDLKNASNSKSIDIYVLNLTIKDLSDIDSDNDTYNDTNEKLIGTDPFDNTSYPLDTDGDNIIDYLDFDDDNDGYNDSMEWSFGTDPLNPNSTPPDLDEDFLPDLIDPDIDGDGVLNEDDDYPYDPKRSEKKKVDNTSLYSAIVGIICVIILIVILFMYVRKQKVEDKSKKKKDNDNNESKRLKIFKD